MEAVLAIFLIGTGVFLFCILPIVLGLMALRQIDRSNGVQRGRGLALGAIVLGALGLLALPLLSLAKFVSMTSSRTRSFSTIATPAPATSITFSAGSGGQRNGSSITKHGPTLSADADELNLDMSDTDVQRAKPDATPPNPPPRASGSVGEMSVDDAFDTEPAPVTPKVSVPSPRATPAPAATPATNASGSVHSIAPATAPKRNTGGSVGEQNIDN